MPRKRKLTDDENADINNDIDVNNDVDDDSDVQNEVTKNKRKKCQAPDCTSLAVSGGRKGYCKAHGGGKRCQHPDCTFSAVSGGLPGYCKAHGCFH